MRAMFGPVGIPRTRLRDDIQHRCIIQEHIPNMEGLQEHIPNGERLLPIPEFQFRNPPQIEEKNICLMTPK